MKKERWVQQFCGIILILLWAVAAEAVVEPSTETVDINELERSELLFRVDGRYQRAVDLSRDIKIAVQGITAKVLVKQKFTNSTEQNLDGLYCFPLPENAAVSSLQMQIGERVIVGKIKEKREARRSYEKAKASGKRASLLVQKRPNIFTTEIANIGPGETVIVEISYQQYVQYRDGNFSLRYPMAITSRYHGKKLQVNSTKEEVNVNADGWSVEPTPVATTAEVPLHIEVNLDSGVAATGVRSVYHSAAVEELTSRNYKVLYGSSVGSEHDFLVEWQARAGSQVTAALFSEEQGDEKYSLLMVMPPQKGVVAVSPRQITYIIDVSGSMSGESIRQARAALLLALKGLKQGDTFNIIKFNHESEQLFPMPKEVSPENIATATAYVQALKADGGTEMAPALDRAFAQAKIDSERIGQVLFITDGAVDNEAYLFKKIAENIGDRRLFTVGIGPAPNSHFMVRAATLGRGTFTYIGKSSEVMEKMSVLLNKISEPVMSSITIEAENGEKLEIFPENIPDLYAGEPLWAVMRSPADVGGITLRGEGSDGPWQSQLQIEGSAKQAGIKTLWGRGKIASLMDQEYLTGSSQEVRQEIIDTALSFSLVSKYTSFVAVEEERLDGSLPPKREKGATQKAFAAGRAKTATASPLLIFLGTLFLVAAAVIYRRRCTDLK